MGTSKTRTKNPVAERAIQELGLECLHLSPEGGPLSKLTLALATSNMNSRLRNDGLAAIEVWTQRDQISGDQLPIDDREYIKKQHISRLENHTPSAVSKSRGRVKATPSPLKVGDLVYLHTDGSKTQARPKYLITHISGNACKVRKFTQSQFRSKTYDVHPLDCFPVQPTTFAQKPPGPIRSMDQSDTSDSDSDTDTRLAHPHLLSQPVDAIHTVPTHVAPPATVAPPVSTSPPIDSSRLHIVPTPVVAPPDIVTPPASMSPPIDSPVMCPDNFLLQFHRRIILVLWFQSFHLYVHLDRNYHQLGSVVVTGYCQSHNVLTGHNNALYRVNAMRCPHSTLVDIICEQARIMPYIE